MREPLQFEVRGEGQPNYVRLYECEHITDGTFPIAHAYNIVHVGDHSSILLCRHCAQHNAGMVVEEMVKRALGRMSPQQLTEFLGLMREEPDTA